MMMIFTCLWNECLEWLVLWPKRQERNSFIQCSCNPARLFTCTNQNTYNLMLIFFWFCMIMHLVKYFKISTCNNLFYWSVRGPKRLMGVLSFRVGIGNRVSLLFIGLDWSGLHGIMYMECSLLLRSFQPIAWSLALKNSFLADKVSQYLRLWNCLAMHSHDGRNKLLQGA